MGTAGADGKRTSGSARAGVRMLIS